MEYPLKALIDAPLANPARINLPMGRRPAPRSSPQPHERRPGDLTPKQVRERKAKATTDRQEKLLDYYATVDVPVERVAEHVGLYRQEQTGRDDSGNPIFSRVLDVERAKAALDRRRRK